MTRTQPAVNRRRLLQAGVATSLLSGLAAADAEPPNEGWIDAHSHIWTPDTEKYPLAKGQSKEVLDPPSFTTEQLLATARPSGIRRVVLIQHHLYYGFDNSYMTDAVAAHPRTFRVVGMVDDRQPHPDQRMRKLLQQKVTGFRITSWIHGDRWLDGAGMAAMWKCGAETRQAMCCLIDPAVLPSVDRMCARYPETPVVIDHFARIGIDGTIRDEDIAQLCRLARHKQTHVKVSAFYALGKKRPPHDELIPMIRRLYESFGPQRLMWASDCPYQLGGDNTYQASVDLITKRIDFFSDEDREWLMRKTAERVYFFG